MNVFLDSQKKLFLIKAIANGNFKIKSKNASPLFFPFADFP